MDNQHQHIKGYSDLTAEEIALMNEAKTLAEQVGALVDKIGKTPNTDQRWLAIGKTDLQKGFMATIRAVARPTTF